MGGGHSDTGAGNREKTENTPPVTTGLEDKQAIDNAVSHARLAVCPTMDYLKAEFTERESNWLKFLHYLWLKRNPEVECSCR